MPSNAKCQLLIRPRATAAAITLIALTGCSSADDRQIPQGARTTTSTAITTTKESKGTLPDEVARPISIPQTAPGEVPKLNVQVSCISEFPGVVSVANRESDETFTYVIPSPRSADTYPREVVEQLYADDDKVQVVDQFEVQLSNTFPVENYFVVNVRTGEITKPDDYCHIKATAPRNSLALLSETVSIAPNGDGRVFTFKFPPGTPAPEPASSPVNTRPSAAVFSDGTYLVGTDIAPGTYRAPGGTYCYYARLSDLSGEFNAIISNGTGVSPIITIAESDAAFTSRRCGQWQPAE